MWLPFLMLLVAAQHVAAQPQSGTATCQAVVTLSTNWVQTSNNATFASVNLDIISTQAAIVPVPWTLTLKNPAYGMIKQVTLYSLHEGPAYSCFQQCAILVTEPQRELPVKVQHCSGCGVNLRAYTHTRTLHMLEHVKYGCFRSSLSCEILCCRLSVLRW